MVVSPDMSRPRHQNPNMDKKQSFKLKEENTLKKFIVIRGRRTIVGSVNCDYSIFDTVTFKSDLDLEDQMRDYVYSVFLDEKCNFNKDDISCRRKNIVLNNGKIFAERIKVFDHEDNSFLGFIPVEVFDFSENLNK